MFHWNAYACNFFGKVSITFSAHFSVSLSKWENKQGDWGHEQKLHHHRQHHIIITPVSYSNAAIPIALFKKQMADIWYALTSKRLWTTIFRPMHNFCPPLRIFFVSWKFLWIRKNWPDDGLHLNRNDYAADLYVVNTYKGPFHVN